MPDKVFHFHWILNVFISYSSYDTDFPAVYHPQVSDCWTICFQCHVSDFSNCSAFYERHDFFFLVYKIVSLHGLIETKGTFVFSFKNLNYDNCQHVLILDILFI